VKPIFAAVVLAGCLPQPERTAPTPAWVDDTSTFDAGKDAAHPSIADRYRDVAAKIVAAARADRGAYHKLEELTDRVGHRFSGSPELDQAIAWALRAFAADGMPAHTEKVMIPRWVRGAEDGAIVTPVARPLHLIGLGGTVSTPKGGITAPVVVVHGWDELEAKRDAVKGAIVLYDVPMPPYSEEHGAGYGQVVGFRWNGAIRASKLGAVGVLMRSVTAHSLRLPHTGGMGYEDDTPKIPAAAVTVEDSELIARLAAAGPISVHLHLESQQLPDVESANVIGEWRGREQPDEVVVIGGHLDSWDVGQGAHDDGAGCVTMMEAIAVLKQLGLVPRRTIRVVLFVNEENGLRGGKAYAATHEAELAKTVLAVESDSGGFAPRGFGVQAKTAAATARMRVRVADLESLLRVIGARRVSSGDSGADVSPMIPAGVPAMGLEVEGKTYFDIHHTEADTFDKVKPQELQDDVAAMAVLAYVAADLPERLDAPIAGFVDPPEPPPDPHPVPPPNVNPTPIPNPNPSPKSPPTGAPKSPPTKGSSPIAPVAK
jgi:hypothetical protein